MRKLLLVLSVAFAPYCSAQYQSALQPALIYMKGNFTGTTNSQGALDACSVALTASKAFLNAPLVFDFGGDQACGAHMLSTVVLGDASTFSGSLTFSSSQGLLLHQYGTDGALFITPRTNIKGQGQSTSAPNPANYSGTVFQACVSGDTHAYCNGSAVSPSVGLLATKISAPTVAGGLSVSAGVATLTFSGTNPFYANETVSLSGSANSACNGIFLLTTATTFSAASCTTDSTNVITVTAVAASLATGGLTVSGGTATINFANSQNVPFFPRESVTTAGSGQTACNGTFKVQSVTTGATPTLTFFIGGSSSCTTDNNHVITIAGPPMQIAFGSEENGSAPGGLNLTSGGMYEAHIETMEVDGNSVPNAIGISDGYCQENCGAMYITVVNHGAGSDSSVGTGGSTGGGIDIALWNGGGTGSTNSKWDTMNIGNGGSNRACTGDALNVLLLNVAPKFFGNATISNGGCAQNPILNYQMAVSGSGAFTGHVSNIHFERAVLAALCVDCFGSAANGWLIDSINACCSVSSNSDSVVRIDTAAGTPLNIELVMIGSRNGGGTAPVNTILDNQNLVTIPSSIRPTVNRYALSGSGSVEYDSSGTALSAFAALIQTPGQCGKTALQSITSTTLTDICTFPLPATAATYSLHCSGIWSQSTGTAGVNFGGQVTGTTNPTHLTASGFAVFNTSGTATDPSHEWAIGNSGDVTNQNATAIFSTITPNAAGVSYWLSIAGTVQTAANGGDTLHVMGQTSNAADALLIQRGWECGINP